MAEKFEETKRIPIEIPQEELVFEFFRSSGPGGQNVNKVSTGVRVRWNIEKSEFLTEEQKEKIKNIYPKRLTNEGEFIIECQKFRSQLRNKESVTERFNYLVEEALKEKKKRKKTTVPKRKKEERLKEKKMMSEKKKLRAKITSEDL